VINKILVNDLMTSSPKEVHDFIGKFKSKFSNIDVLNYLKKIKNLKILVIGEIIIDEYIYCDALGKSGKEATLAMKYRYSERYAGGSLAIANHISNFSNNVALASYLGDRNSEETFVCKNLNENVETIFISKSNSPTIVKKRIIDKYSMSKLLGVYDINDDWLTSNEEKELYDILEKRLSEFDLVIIADYDHGLITPKIVDLLAEKAPFLSVNTQVNAANIGFHAISKYHRADFICTNESEIRLDRRNRKGELKELIKELAEKISCNKIMITRGTNGSMVFSNENGFTACPAFAIKIVDRVGAGDAVLSITSMLAAINAPAEIISFIGNLVGAEAVAIVGNKKPLQQDLLIKGINDFLGNVL